MKNQPQKAALTVRGADWGAGAAFGAAVGVVVLLSVGIDAAPPAESEAAVRGRRQVDCMFAREGS